MDIGILQAYFSREQVGGGEIHTQQLTRALEDLGHEVTIFTNEPETRRSGIDDLQVREFPVPVELNPVTELSLAHRAWEELHDCDVVTLTDESAWRGVDVAVPTVMIFHLVWHGWVHRHGPLFRVLRRKPQALLYRWMERKITCKADAVVAISPNMAEDIARVRDVGQRLHRIPNGVDIQRFTPKADKYETFTVHFQGRLIEMKNPGVLVEAARQSSGNWRLTIGGDGPLREDLERKVVEYGLTDRVEILGYVPDDELPERYARSHVYALPSDYEGMPLTVLEAAASGTAVLASPRAATDFVDDTCGWVVKPAASEIASILDQVERDVETSIEKGTVARSKAETYTWRSIGKQYEKLFQQLS